MDGTPAAKQAKLDEHVAYEVRMCALQTARLIAWPAYRDWVVDNALLEAALVHVRALISFTRIDGRVYPDDIVATDYLDGWAPGPEAAVSLLKSEFNSIHKNVAHLTAARTEGDEKKTWQIGVLATCAVRVMREFADALAAEGSYVPTAVLAAVSDAEQALASTELEYSEQLVNQAWAADMAWRPGPAGPTGATGPTMSSPSPMTTGSTGPATFLGATGPSGP